MFVGFNCARFCLRYERFVSSAPRGLASNHSRSHARIVNHTNFVNINFCMVQVSEYSFVYFSYFRIGAVMSKLTSPSYLNIEIELTYTFVWINNTFINDHVFKINIVDKLTHVIFKMSWRFDTKLKINVFDPFLKTIQWQGSGSRREVQ